MSISSSALRPLIIVLTLATALIHIYLAVYAMGNDVLFILNGVGYIGLLAVLYAPLSFLSSWRGQARWALIGYTALTILLWVVMALIPGQTSLIGYLTKLIEVALIVCLWLQKR